MEWMVAMQQAFTGFHGIAPKFAREESVKLVLFYPLVIKITVDSSKKEIINLLSMDVTNSVIYVTYSFFIVCMLFATFKSAHWQNLKEKGQQTMKGSGNRLLFLGSIFIVAFIIWTLLIQKVDVQPLGVNGTNVGFATINGWFYKLTGVHMTIYTITDWLGIVPLFVCMIFAGIGFVQLVKRGSLIKVDYDIIFLGIYYIIVIFGYLIFEIFPINYRPILIDGFMEASYPSSTTLLVLSVMPTLIFQVNRRTENIVVKTTICILTSIFSTFMVIGRLISGVHWFTDIVGSIMISAGLFCIYKSAVLLCYKEEH